MQSKDEPRYYTRDIVMKKLITMLLTTCIYVVASAQIQTKFWGLEMGATYASLELAKETIKSKCHSCEIKENGIKSKGGQFAGYNWDFVDFSFYNNTLFFVHFSSYYKTQDLANEKFYSLYYSLITKYGQPFSENHNNKTSLSDVWCDDTSMRCFLHLLKAESMAGHENWYVNLTYYNNNIFNMSLEAELDEL